MAVEESVKIVISAEDKASSLLSKIGDGTSKLGSALTSLGGIAATAFTAATAAVTTFAVDSLHAYIESEKQMTIANTALQNTIEEMSGKQLESLNETLGTTGSSFEAMQKVMEQVSQSAVKLGFDDEDAAVAFAKLFQVSQDVTQAQSDLSLAENLAAFSGRSLAESADAITKVHAGATRVLKDFGIQLDDSATSAQALDILQAKVADSAYNMANTTSGKLTILQTSWQNLQEEVGAALATAITPFIDALTKWAQDPATQQQFQEIAGKVAALAAQLGPLVQKLIPALVDGMKLTINIIQGLGTAFNATTDFLGTLIFKVMQFVDWVKQMVDQVKEAIQWLEKLAQKTTAGIKSGIDAILPGAQFRAEGGPVSSGSPYIVGENGPELFIPGSNGSISPNGSFGGISIQINGTFLDQDAAERMANMMIDRLKLELRY